MERVAGTEGTPLTTTAMSSARHRGRGRYGYRELAAFVRRKRGLSRPGPLIVDESPASRRRRLGARPALRESVFRRMAKFFYYRCLYSKLLPIVLFVIIPLGSLMGGALVDKVLEVRQKQDRLALTSNLTFLLMGEDHVEGKGRSDTIVVVNLWPQTGKIRLVSVPRDTYVQVRYGERRVWTKINHAYRWGGVPLAREAVEGLIGRKVDHHVIVNYDLFRQIIDELGGVRLIVEKDMDYEDRAGGLSIHLKQGMQILDGQRALEYVRFRADHQGDLGRIARQQKFIRAFMAKLREPGVLLRLLGKIPELLENLKTDVPLSVALLVAQRYRKLQRKDLSMRMVPGDSELLPSEVFEGRKLSYFVVDRKSFDALLLDWFLFRPATVTGSVTAGFSPLAPPTAELGSF